MTTVDDLPDEIIKQIFQSIPLPKRKQERRNLVLVSKRFKTLGDETIGLELFIGEPPWSGWEATAGSDHVSLSRIQDVGVSICHVGEILDTSPKPKGFINVLWGFWGKESNLHGTVAKIQAPPFIIHNPIYLLDPQSLTNLDIESLQFLEISADFAYIFHNIDDDKILGNTLAVLSNAFPHLISVNVYIPFESSQFDYIDEDSTEIVDVELEQLAARASEYMELQALILHLNVDRMKCLNYWSRVFRIFNVEFLPRNIHHIDIARIPVLSEDLAFIMLSIPTLIHFVAKFVGKTGEMGVLLETLIEVISRRQLRWFLLAGSINGHFPDEGISNGHPSRPVALLEDDETFCAKIGRSGYYTMGSPFDDLHHSLNLRAGIRSQQDQ
ncbi:unnamed protein product [Allacma fusca]|uniref:F-box domain-containing protein n=1 Tax=Allacma fusca TaxID=39272 RepID=A0A8J2PGV6_9HEXA|nr:unnamed protein product [Allacma fusca]